MSQVFYAKQVQEVPIFLFARKHKKANMWKGNINYVVKLNVASVLAFMGFIPLKKIKAFGRN
ncbi:hypothetical protein [Lysinibacillus xylanilyticus]|uniref:Transposase n=1 Tax=Lysinibacillus xylanilyticus TaxID=582475 RepID=A0ABT4EWV4_9BACI|nr:hypothetical protein [Lysinibacillus xylanilyticus]MCY9548674.1 hypothetical protein [Lysinibacillus xylanilyticus]